MVHSISWHLFQLTQPGTLVLVVSDRGSFDTVEGGDVPPSFHPYPGTQLFS